MDTNTLSRSEVWPRSYRIILRIFVILSWAPAVFASKLLLWDNRNFEVSIFAMDYITMGVFWIALLGIQGAYLCYSFLSTTQAASTSPALELHFTVNNLLHMAFTALAINSQFQLAEVTLFCNFFNLLAAYTRHPRGPLLGHIGIVSGPLSWVSVAILWNGSMMFPHRESLVAGVFGTILIWLILGEGAICGIACKDITMTLCLSVLSGALGVGQYRLMGGSDVNDEDSMQLVILLVQCTFALIIAAILFVWTLGLGLNMWLRRRRTASEEDKNFATEKSNPQELQEVGISQV